ncbi:MAG: hypothetical protein IJF92_04525 [Bacilli bacterium]|nr:hypothetical protein [Bacilli bacterium]
MSDRTIFIADLNNKEHLELFEDYERKNNLHNILDYIRENDLNSVILKQILFLKDKEGIKDSCFISAEKDKKTCFIDFPNTDQVFRNRTLITYAENYSFNTLGMEEIFIQTKIDNKNLINNLESKEYENLGDTNGLITFMKEKEKDLEQGRIMNGTR